MWHPPGLGHCSSLWAKPAAATAHLLVRNNAGLRMLLIDSKNQSATVDLCLTASLQIKHPGVVRVLEPMEESGGQVRNTEPLLDNPAAGEPQALASPRPGKGGTVQVGCARAERVACSWMCRLHEQRARLGGRGWCWSTVDVVPKFCPCHNLMGGIFQCGATTHAAWRFQQASGEPRAADLNSISSVVRCTQLRGQCPAILQSRHPNCPPLTMLTLATP